MSNLPNAALVFWIHWRAKWAVESSSKVMTILQWSQHSHRAGRMHAAADFRQRVFRPHPAAPNLRIVEEKQLIVIQIDSG